jgi:hypothetical protein
VATNAGRLISGGGSDKKIQIGCNIDQLPQFVNICFLPKAARAAGYLPNERRLIPASAPVITDDRQGYSRLYRRDSTRACTPS